MFEVLASQSTEPQKYVKLKRVIKYKNGIAGNCAGSGTAKLSETVGADLEMQRRMALARAINDLVAKLKAAGKYTQVSDNTDKDWIPESHKLLKFYKVAKGEQPPGHIEFTASIPEFPPNENPHYLLLEDEPGGDHSIQCSVYGHLVGAEGTITFRWKWGLEGDEDEDEDEED